jgi:hypothetical protein
MTQSHAMNGLLKILTEELPESEKNFREVKSALLNSVINNYFLISPNPNFCR